ncbi:helix-turn-helix domain-containing protein [Kibdelosporangium phytohabitans]|uniref:XRE family transcriptional regulator n=1 Tax=Kibdelosporangium phytohabitans TaxID=860235 RepID=A0A0N9I7N9_9PSEU|nr:helix-turn-helix transcriptional regulator [Kibdelosporangium phytohabitans]ALG11828.1 XRE family transcriptional regulator [Kibdelosporangium phytohabitans]MBE1463245.1 transcriptional regulator with XRE-family HTH domain [Kibdelosporangium phytohabitans]
MSTMGDTTREMATFLRTRRERLAPGEVGLPDRKRARRTPGLRREEVAELAGVSVDYVVRLEQGRGLRPSADVLDALAGALRLSEDERAYLFDLARQRQAGRQRKTEVADQLVRLLGDLSPLPAMVVNHRNDILAWNPEMTKLVLDFGEVPEAQRNGLWLCLLHPSMRTFYLDRAQIIREGIADLRAAWAMYPDDPTFAQLVDELTGRSDEFAHFWAQQDVQVRGRGVKRMRHPVGGLLTVTFEVLTSLQDPDQRLIVYRAAEQASQAALDAITGR